MFEAETRSVILERLKKYYAESELIINPDGSIFHLHIKPEQLANIMQNSKGRT